jgi:hypothetical protein
VFLWQLFYSHSYIFLSSSHSPLRYLLTLFSTELNSLGPTSPVYFIVWRGWRGMKKLGVLESWPPQKSAFSLSSKWCIVSPRSEDEKEGESSVVLLGFRYYIQVTIEALPNASSIYSWSSIHIQVLSSVPSVPTYTKSKIHSHKTFTLRLCLCRIQRKENYRAQGDILGSPVCSG